MIHDCDGITVRFTIDAKEALSQIRLEKIDARIAGLLRQCRMNEGADDPISAASVMLATMVVEDDLAIDAFAVAVGGWRSVERMIAGTLLPCQSWSEMLGRLTGGRITAAMFEQPWQGDMPEGMVAQDSPEGEPPRPGAPAGAAAVQVQGRIGEVPSGPLFTATVDPAAPGTLILSGLGLALRLDEATGFALRSALSAGLIDLRGQLGGQLAAPAMRPAA